MGSSTLRNLEPATPSLLPESQQSPTLSSVLPSLQGGKGSDTCAACNNAVESSSALELLYPGPSVEDKDAIALAVMIAAAAA